VTEAHSIRVLLIEDDEDVRLSTEQALSLAGFKVEAFASAERARASSSTGLPAVVVCDVGLPGLSGTDWLPEIRKIDAEIPVVLITGSRATSRWRCRRCAKAPTTSSRSRSARSGWSRSSATRRAPPALAAGAQPARCARELARHPGAADRPLGADAEGAPHRDDARRTSADVLIYGETGTGKELVARCLHDHSERRRQHFVPLNCGGLPEALAESELFGHEGRRVHERAPHAGRQVRACERRHLFLDEIESMPMAVQIKLLRALQERSIERIGSNKAIPFDCRVVAASKDDLKSLSDQHKFRPTCTTASASRSSSCRRCASGARTSRCCSSTSR
jgi:two-component system C4-dicarboxylate transport response regulator DctD